MNLIVSPGKQEMKARQTRNLFAQLHLNIGQQSSERSLGCESTKMN
jgi:hypothetical protein